MANTKAQVDWQAIDDNTLSAIPSFAEYASVKTALDQARKTFETDAVTLMEKAKVIPEGKKPIFGYRFGKPAIAFIDDDGKGKTGTFSFAIPKKRK